MKKNLLLGFALLNTIFCWSATITVTNTNDSGVGSLRQEIANASQGDTINFSLNYPATITLTSGQIIVNKSLTIQGPSSDSLTIDGNSNGRIFYWGGNWSNVYSVNISGITFTNGKTVDVGVGCEAGASIRYENHGSINISDCNFTNNDSHCNGGALDLNGGDMVARISKCFFQNNVGAGTGSGGGALVANIDSLIISKSTFEQNQFVSSNGGAVAISSNYSQIINSTFYNNEGQNGSAVSFYVMGDFEGEINSCTFSSNTLSEALYVEDDFMVFSPCTLSLTNNILENNINFASSLSSGQVTIQSLGNNISSDNSLSSIFTQSGDLNNVNPLLDPSGLQENDGDTPTIAIQCNSPAKDAGSSANAPLTDQRGRSRSGLPDIGAYELNIQNTIAVTACENYTVPSGDETYLTTGVYMDTLSSVDGCASDSVITIQLTINNPATGTDTRTECNSYTWIDGNTYTANNSTATFNIVNGAANGCDSLVTLDLTIVNSTTGTDTRTECNPYTWIDGNTYTANNSTATFNIVNGASNGCDSLVTLDLTIVNSTTGTDTRTECNSYTWIDGQTYTANNNTATFNIINGAANGCDSLVTLDLTIINSTTGTDTRTECDSYTWIDGQTYTANNNTATFNIVNGAANGCDSLVTLDLTINSVSDLTTANSGLTISANNTGATYQWLDCDNNYAVLNGETGQSFTATANGNYAVELTENGCVDTTACTAISTVGILENNFGNEFKIYPNPTDGNFSIDLGENHNSITVKMTDLNGKLIQSKQYNNSNLLNLSINEPAGIYLLLIESSNKKAIIRLVKE